MAQPEAPGLRGARAGIGSGLASRLRYKCGPLSASTALWISLGLLVIVFKGRNAWLVVAFAAAALHQVEHFYLFWLNHADDDLYLSGGVAGIMGNHGLIGS